MVPLLAARHRTKRRYVLSALVRCSICGRRMQGNSVRDHSWYRWKFPSDYAITERISHPKSVQVQEDSITAGLDAWLAKLTDPANVDELAAQLATRRGRGQGSRSPSRSRPSQDRGLRRTARQLPPRA